MYNELIIMTFPREENAEKAWQALEMMYEGQLFELTQVVIVVRDSAGQTTFHRHGTISAQPGDRANLLPNLLAEAIFEASGKEGRQQAIEAGLDEIFCTDVAQALIPDSSALLIYVSGDSLVDTRRHLETLGRLRGILHHTTFAAQVEEALLKSMVDKRGNYETPKSP